MWSHAASSIFVSAAWKTLNPRSARSAYTATLSGPAGTHVGAFGDGRSS